MKGVLLLRAGKGVDSDVLKDLHNLQLRKIG